VTAIGEVMPTMRADPDVASIPRRTLAGTIDAVLGVLVFVGGGVTVAWRRRSSGEWSMPQGRTVNAFGWAMRATALLLRNRGTPGQRLLGIRRIDARTPGGRCRSGRPSCANSSTSASSDCGARWPAVTRSGSRQTIVDRLSGTVLVRERR
jgi:hypothetical protein